ncbi:hypothetical protein OJAV_G00026560 [Oryzias javanicus]|uniref:Synapse-associated protein 1 n=1 Tax=Oryzias javanicus TaxID=123683 RepID=A0A3S2N6V9_ORYJA|nr:hypothetical protein OJAV_G00026560 [Oryzias javanicus]
MFKGLGTWLGLDNPAHAKTSEDKEEQNVVQEVKEEAETEVNKHPAAELQQRTEAEQDDADPGTGLSGFIFSFASNATKKISESVVETAHNLKKTVEEGKIDGIIDKTFLGDFQKEQEKFVQEKKAKKSEAAVPPWVGYNEEETIQQQILALSAVRVTQTPAVIVPRVRTLRAAPVIAGQEELPARPSGRSSVPLRHGADVPAGGGHAGGGRAPQPHALRPRSQTREGGDVLEELLLQSVSDQAVGSAHGAGGAAAEGRAPLCGGRHTPLVAVSPENVALTDSVRAKTPPVSISDLKKEDEVEISTSPGVSEFVSDAFDSAAINQEDLRKEMEQLVLDKKDGAASPDDFAADWEKELQQELQEYEVVTESDNKDDQWDQEIEKMLQADDS